MRQRPPPTPPLNITTLLQSLTSPPNAARNAMSGRVLVLYFHGNAGNIGNRLIMYNQLWEQCQVNVLAVDYRGYGDSEEATPTERGLNADADAALAWLLKRPDVQSGSIFVLGRSLGGAVSIALAARVAKARPALFRFRGVVVENTFTSINDIGKLVLPFLAKVPPALLHCFLTNRWRSIDAVAELPQGVPVLFVSGAKDELIPQAQMAALRERAVEAGVDVEWREFANGHHNDTWQSAGYQDMLSDFIHRRCMVVDE